MHKIKDSRAKEQLLGYDKVLGLKPRVAHIIYQILPLWLIDHDRGYPAEA